MNTDKTKKNCAALLVVAMACGRMRPVECRLFPDGKAAVCEQARDGKVTVSRQSLSHAEFGPERGCGGL